MAVSTTRARWVNVAQPRPYRPGSLVKTFTTTRRIAAGAVRMVLTWVIFRGGSLRASVSCAGAGGAEPKGRSARQGRPAMPAPTVMRFSHCRLCMKGLLLLDFHEE